jgi:hypothetical protein
MPVPNDIAIVHVQLDDVSPPIWRRLAAPTTNRAGARLSIVI